MFGRWRTPFLNARGRKSVTRSTFYLEKNKNLAAQMLVVPNVFSVIIHKSWIQWFIYNMILVSVQIWLQRVIHSAQASLTVTLLKKLVVCLARSVLFCFWSQIFPFTYCVECNWWRYSASAVLGVFARYNRSLANSITKMKTT